MLSFFEDENQVQFDGPRQNYGLTGSINFNNDVDAYNRSQMNPNTGQYTESIASDQVDSSTQELPAS